MNKFVRSSMDGELPISSLEVDAPVTCPGDVTLSEVEELSMLEPYGAGNPRPVFALLGATVDAVQSVGQGRHLKLRLSKGTCRFDAIFFSVTAQECGVEAGMRVDAAFYLQVNTFRGNTALQLQLIDLRPSLIPSRHEAEAIALCRRCREGEDLTAQEVARLRTTREQFALYWTVLEHWLRHGKVEGAELPLLRSLAAAGGGNESFLRAILSVQVFSERGLLSVRQGGDTLTLRLVPVQGKVDLFACPYLVRLQGPSAT
ncbi:MAG: hypothetical protein LKJ86_02205 [Oscillibacter sp.]|jgi:single-stranded-DNA-specific exonuclease|nr:hypothetical protein [Oscillibacter sp.]